MGMRPPCILMLLKLEVLFVRETGKRKRVAFVLQAECVACGCCLKVCPRNAIAVVGGIFAAVDAEKCIGCGKCARECPAAVIAIGEVTA